MKRKATEPLQQSFPNKTRVLTSIHSKHTLLVAKDPHNWQEIYDKHPNLTYLRYQYSNLTDERLLKIAELWGKSLHGISIERMALDTFETFASIPNLTHVYLEHVDTPCTLINALASYCRNLTHITITSRRNADKTRDDPLFSLAKNCKNLRVLRLKCKLHLYSNDGIILLCRSLSLQELYLSNYPFDITDDLLKIVATSKLTTLCMFPDNVLKIKYTKIGCQAIEETIKNHRLMPGIFNVNDRSLSRISDYKTRCMRIDVVIRDVWIAVNHVLSHLGKKFEHLPYIPAPVPIINKVHTISDYVFGTHAADNYSWLIRNMVQMLELDSASHEFEAMHGRLRHTFDMDDLVHEHLGSCMGYLHFQELMIEPSVNRVILYVHNVMLDNVV